MKLKALKITYQNGSTETIQNVQKYEEIPYIWAHVTVGSEYHIDFLNHCNPTFPSITGSSTKYEAVFKRINAEYVNLLDFFDSIRCGNRIAKALHDALCREMK